MGCFGFPLMLPFFSEQIRRNLQLGLRASPYKKQPGRRNGRLFFKWQSHTQPGIIRSQSKWIMQSDGMSGRCSGANQRAWGGESCSRQLSLGGTRNTDNSLYLLILKYNNTIVCRWRESTGRWEKPARWLSNGFARRSRTGKPTPHHWLDM